MASTVAISPQDVNDAANFLEQFLSDVVPDGDFSKGTSLRDLTLGALASVFAFLRKQNTDVRQLQSLKTVQAVLSSADPETLRDAVVGILSNFFIAPKAGTPGRGNALGHISQAVDIFIPTTARFTRLAGVTFRVDSDTTFFISRDQLVPIIDAGGIVLEYQFTFPLIALKTGVGGNIKPGLFAGFDTFSPFVTRIENVDTFGGGRGVESVTEILARAPTAISVRNLINERSIAVVLQETFPDTRGIYVVGYGAPEMQRDRLERVASHLAIHIGGKVDIYVLLDVIDAVFEGTVGGLFARPDGVISVLRDSTANFAAVQVGDILRILAGFPSVPAEYRIAEVRSATELVVSESVPFALATDEQTPVSAVEYSIGRLSPGFRDVILSAGATGHTSRSSTRPGRITMPGQPVMEILDIALVDPPLAEASLINAADGMIHFSVESNSTPVNAANPLEFQTIVNNPLVAQSRRQWLEVVIGTDTNQTRWDGYTLRVRYRTLAGFSAIDTFVSSPLERTVAADQLVRGHNPVTVSMVINYRLRATATTLLNESAAIATLVEFVNTYDTSVTPIDMSSLASKLKATYPDIATVFPFTIYYTLSAPNGQFVSYATEDEVIIDAAKKTISSVNVDHVSLGVSARTIRYLTNSQLITLVRV